MALTLGMNYAARSLLKRRSVVAGRRRPSTIPAPNPISSPTTKEPHPIPGEVAVFSVPAWPTAGGCSGSTVGVGKSSTVGDPCCWLDWRSLVAGGVCRCEPVLLWLPRTRPDGVKAVRASTQMKTAIHIDSCVRLLIIKNLPVNRSYIYCQHEACQ